MATFLSIIRFAQGVGLLIAYSCAAAQTIEVGPYFPLEEDRSWSYVGNPDTTLISEPGLIVNGIATMSLTNRATGDKRFFTSDTQGVREHGQKGVVVKLTGETVIGNMTFSPPLQWAPPTVDVGRATVSNGTLELDLGPQRGVFSARYNATTTITAPQAVPVPAGTFDAIRVEQVLTATFSISGQPYVVQDRTSHWLARGVGVVLKQYEDNLGMTQTDRLASFSEPAINANSPQMVAAILPISRSVALSGIPATVFATIINTSRRTTAHNCGIALASDIPATLTYQTTNPLTNALTGTSNTAVSIDPGQAKSFVIGIAPRAEIAPTDVALKFDCANTSSAARFVGVNTLLLSASSTSEPDLIALAATHSGDGIVKIPGIEGTGAFAVASVNLGRRDTIRVAADTGSNDPLPVSLKVCETVPETGVCKTDPAASVTTTIETGQTPTFAVFVRALLQPLPFEPATRRVFVRFFDSNRAVRGATSVAVTTE